ncbi:MAG: cytochrome c-type biogenesis protein CcmH [Fidelibacterota bacterium]
MTLRLALVTVLLPLAVLASEKEEAMIRNLERTLMASCFHGTVAEHGNAQMEKEIRDFVYQGKTKQDIIDYYVGIYGERILAAPRARGFNLAAWLAPALVFLAGVAILLVYIRHRSGEPEPPPPPDETTKTPFDDIVERELEELE